MNTTEQIGPRIVSSADVSVPPMQAVASSNIQEIGYDPALQRLFVRFSPTSLYAFEGVNAATWDIFQGTESKGRYFASDIKGKYPSMRIVAPQS